MKESYFVKATFVVAHAVRKAQAHELPGPSGATHNFNFKLEFSPFFLLQMLHTAPAL